MVSKEAVRLACKTKRAALCADECALWAQDLATQVLALPEYQQAHSIMLYLAMPKEANLDAVVEQALADGKQVYVPVCVDKTKMVAARLTSMDDIEYGVLHIRIPKSPYEIIKPEDIDLVMVPGAGFDRQGGRMGMGNGYYDRFLQSVRPGHFVAVAWQAQLSEDTIPMEDYDVRMTKIVTEQAVIVPKV